MKKKCIYKQQKNGSMDGFTLLEVVVAVLVLSLSAAIFLTWQGSTWSRTRQTNDLMDAGHVIKKQLEAMRMYVAKDPVTNYANFASMDTTWVDSSVTPPVTVDWVITPAYDPDSVEIEHVKNVELIASWGSQDDDTLRVSTCISRNF